MRNGLDMHVFKKGIKPVWEDEANRVRQVDRQTETILLENIRQIAKIVDKQQNRL